MEALDRIAIALFKLSDRLDRLLPTETTEPAWESATAFRWQGTQASQPLQALPNRSQLSMADLLGIERQKEELDRNTRQFLAGAPANNALLWGARGTGKSSLVRALLNEYSADGLRAIEVNQQHLVELAEIQETLHKRPEKFILYCDDLSFEADDAGYKRLKAVLEGSLNEPPTNILIYATSNRRHLLPESPEDNRNSRWIEGELHPSDAIEEKISLSERFGLWLSFQPFDQNQFLTIVDYWLARLGDKSDGLEARTEALRFSLLRGSRSGRVAWQFAKDWVGRQQLSAPSR